MLARSNLVALDDGGAACGRFAHSHHHSYTSAALNGLCVSAPTTNERAQQTTCILQLKALFVSGARKQTNEWRNLLCGGVDGGGPGGTTAAALRRRVYYFAAHVSSSAMNRAERQASQSIIDRASTTTTTTASWWMHPYPGLASSSAAAAADRVPAGFECVHHPSFDHHIIISLTFILIHTINLNSSVSSLSPAMHIRPHGTRVQRFIEASIRGCWNENE